LARFTKKSILGIPLPIKGRKLKTEGNGLYIHITPKGKRKWRFLFRWKGFPYWINLGKYPALSIREARCRAREYQYQVDRGINPLAEELCSYLTVDELCEEYLNKWAIPNKKTWREDKRLLEVDILPFWKNKLAANIKRRDVVNLLERIYGRGAPAASNHVLSLIKRIYNFGIERALVEQSPASGIKPLSANKSRERVLTNDEIKSFWHGLDQSVMDDKTKLGLKLILVTAQRPGEVLRMQRLEIENDWWVLPGHKVKNGKTHRIYLSSLAMKLIDNSTSDADYILESRLKKRPMSSSAMAHALKKRGYKHMGIDHFVPHDLRRTAATGIAKLGYPTEVIAKILNHSLRGITAVYNRYQYDEQVKEAMQAWADMLTDEIL
jgi:integrase